MAKIFVICGHGAGDSGAVGNGYTEAERVRALGKRIKELGGSSVMLGDVNRNYYADNGISSLTISKDYQIVELHMDSASASARGGHVIIKSGFDPDKYDEALAKMLKEILPGRSQMIVKRSDLANPKRAAAKGYGYRLVEFGFISNKNDVSVFNSRMDDIAKGVLLSFGIKVSGSSSSSGSSSGSTSKPSSGSSISYYKKFSSTSIVDGLKSIGVDSSMANRKKIAAANGISNYSGTASQNTKLLDLAKQGKLKKAGSSSSGSSSSSGASHYKKFSSTSIVDGLKSIGVDSSFSNRAKIAKANGISNYEGTASQNTKLLDLAKQGKLKKA